MTNTVNTLAALFELADREFKEIRLATEAEIERAESEDIHALAKGQAGPTKRSKNSYLNAFGFLKIAKHFFGEYEFEDFKVDGFTEEIVSVEPEITRTDFNEYMKATIGKVKQYQVFFERQSESNEQLNPFTIIRHCLFLTDKVKYSSLLTNVSKEAFERWLMENDG